LGPNDYHISPGQERILTKSTRDNHDLIIVQEKLDGGNVGVCKVNNSIHAITRKGWRCIDSTFKTHHLFNEYVIRNNKRFSGLLNEGERICGEWLAIAAGTRYELKHEQFVVFDIMVESERICYMDFLRRACMYGFTVPHELHKGCALSVEAALKKLGTYGYHGATEPAEGVVYRCERKGKVDFLAKYVRPEKQDGKYFETEIENKTTVYK
jgi:ATP-dependent RNA circularization protein (DNA/RNA ligase family)